MSIQIEKDDSRRYSEDEVLRQIEQAVLDHRLPPGTKLKEVQLANLFGVKRGTIRKVLTRLAHSRLVEQTPNRGATVAKPSVQEGKDLFATRRVLGAFALWTGGYWLVRGTQIILADHSLGFTLVHTVLMVVSIGLAGWAWVRRPA